MSSLYIFNPTGELALANGTNSYMPPKNLRSFEKDLAFLPSYFASTGDAVLMENTPDEDFLNFWQQLGLPKIKYAPINSLLKTSNIEAIKPWSWNQVIHQKYKSVKEICSREFKTSPNYIWNQEHKMFFSRNSANTIQKYIHNHYNNHACISIKNPAINLYSLKEFEQWINSNPIAIIKMPWSSSGRGIHVINPQNNLAINYPWIQGALNQQGFITAEPLLDKVFDFSFQMEIKRNGQIDFNGVSFFNNDAKGHFIGGNINWPHKESEISCFLNRALLNETASILTESIKTINPHQYYEGPIGIDAIVYKDGDTTKIHPCVDINWRYNMGVVNINVPKFVHKASKGAWRIGSFKPREWNDFIALNKKTTPLIVNQNKIVSGFVNMTPPNENAHFAAWMDIGR
ncbi:hypothetical protein [Plebeiibacterium marinum]|uniref:ATP-grasp domain-containing protein n=1 Tax=Plebeiibacterium marinum TaxID=2992111 RepID=A0AAE3MHE8_9BACT|nr:hypothetical protein [Plebeiobacterium marinum]MCW3807717.1 hypothetical protein [Plebeiobacterium marinum]